MSLPEDRLRAALALSDEGLHDQALGLYDQIVRVLSGSVDPEYRIVVVHALIGGAQELVTLDRIDEALSRFDLVVERFADDDEGMKEQVLQARVIKANRLRVLRRLEESIALSDATVVRYDNEWRAVARMWVASAYANQIACLGELDRPDEAIRVARELASFVDGEDDPGIRGVAIRALLDEAHCHKVIGATDEALAIYDAVGSGDLGIGRPHIAGEVLRGAVNAAAIRHARGDLERAIRGLADTIERVVDEPGATARYELGCAEAARAQLLGEGGRLAEAIAGYDRAIELCEPPMTLDHRERSARYLILKGKLLEEADEPIRAADSFRTVFERFAGDSDGSVLQIAAWGGYETVRVLLTLSHDADAKELARRIEACFESSSDEYILDIVRNASFVAHGAARPKGLWSKFGARRRA